MVTRERASGTVRVGVLGCADIARRRMLPAFAAQPLVDLTAVASRDLAKARSFTEPYGCAAVQGYERLLARPDIDAVYIPLPTAMHAEWTVRALEAGKHVLCEKPCVTGPDAAARVVAAARRRGLLVMESFMFLHHGQHARVRELLRDGAIGELREITAEFGIPGPPQAAAGAAVSSLLETGVYPLRAARLFAGGRLEVLGAALTPSPAAGGDLAGGALLRSAAGVTARLSFGWERSYRCSYELWGSAGRLTLDRAFTTPDDHAPVLRLESPDGTRELTLNAEAQFVNVAGVFARTVLHGTGFEAHAEDILEQAELVDAVRRAAFPAFSASELIRVRG
ncbi:Gfo/Idh/MocA family protein [Streptomyces sp. TRM68416]|uniref:Gfo/Idh/MocA family protein n=1 Tax=Streptomyces sp. TRM68416 TaxID=2758412 RepID=UPI001661F496|nr:Gfo/Idh/MocA family oxidoreductase [Streptomyces sp. TRM68416]MBD0842317.1 Gfo/Idh/MocA family oxidoreductase [Streptomyces sp. TRM68416]